ncbi:MAG: hypothetical protein AABW82_05210 [Nanoarchaeota archaeon]
METERKFLICENGGEFATHLFYKTFGNLSRFHQRVKSDGNPIRQGYLNVEGLEGELLELTKGLEFEPKEARLRATGVRLDGRTEYTFTLKGEGDLTRSEKEFTIKQSLFDAYWNETQRRRIIKSRLKLPFEDQVVEFDAYTDRNLLVAEIEFPSEDRARQIPDLGLDVTDKRAYKNINLAR